MSSTVYSLIAGILNFTGSFSPRKAVTHFDIFLKDERFTIIYEFYDFLGDLLWIDWLLGFHWSD